MSTVQKVIIIGNLGADPEMRYTANGSAVANMSVATTETWRDKQTSERKSETEWHKIACFNKLAENCGEYLRKGSKVYVEGKLKTRKWTGQDNVERYSTEVVAHDVQFLDSKGGGQQSGGQPAQGGGAADDFDDSEKIPF